MSIGDFRKDLHALAREDRAKVSQRFFKTGPGQYGEGDIFIGVTVPETRAVIKRHVASLSLDEVEDLLFSKIHEERLSAVIMLVEKYKQGDDKTKKEIYDLYLKNAKQINNWDLVDVSAEHIVGAYLRDRSKKVLTDLAQSKNIWERRIAMISTFHYIKSGSCDTALTIADVLLPDKHDLIQKAVGWMLREVGKRCGQAHLEDFLKKHYSRISRTTLRYAIERISPALRKKYLQGDI